jgi:hypothetical protein
MSPLIPTFLIETKGLQAVIASITSKAIRFISEFLRFNFIRVPSLNHCPLIIFYVFITLIIPFVSIIYPIILLLVFVLPHVSFKFQESFAFQIAISYRSPPRISSFLLKFSRQFP